VCYLAQSPRHVVGNNNLIEELMIKGKESRIGEKMPMGRTSMRGKVEEIRLDEWGRNSRNQAIMNSVSGG